MIGKICKARTPFYDNLRGKMSIKTRPVLIIAKADSNDYVVLPVSSITYPANIHPKYDIKVEPSLYPKLKLNKTSFIRTHKQTVIYRSDIGDKIGDLKSDYEDLFLEILVMREEFSKLVAAQAIDKKIRL